MWICWLSFTVLCSSFQCLTRCKALLAFANRDSSLQDRYFFWNCFYRRQLWLPPPILVRQAIWPYRRRQQLLQRYGSARSMLAYNQIAFAHRREYKLLWLLGMHRLRDYSHGSVVLLQGCFWGVEHYINKKFKSAIKSSSVGYSGGKVQNPSYQQVCSWACSK